MRNAITLFGLLLFSSLQAGAQVFYLDANLPPVVQAFAGNDQTVNPGDSVQIGGNPAAADGYGNYYYLWTPDTGINNPTAPNPWAKPYETTVYRLTVYDGHHCVAEDEITVRVEASGIDVVPNPFSVNVYPNPTGDQVNIRIKGGGGQTSVMIIDALGRKISETISVEPEDTIITMDVRGWTRGIYYLAVRNGNHLYRQSIVIL
jgi:hypothetical protein